VHELVALLLVDVVWCGVCRTSSKLLGARSREVSGSPAATSSAVDIDDVMVVTGSCVSSWWRPSAE
jgi:hypothetical protein